MDRSIFSFKNIITLAFIFISSTYSLKAADTNDNSILIITSYNPDIKSMADNISAFLDEYKKKNGKLDVSVESMNVQNLSEIDSWKGRMQDILSKYQQQSPSLIVLLGQEAWSSFLSQSSSFAHKVPVICGMVSLRTVLLPDEKDINVKEWLPESKDVVNDFRDFNIVGGIVNNYDVEKNIQLIKGLYPQNNKLYFISDNSFGGICMQANVRKYIRDKNITDVDFIDGRQKTFLDVSEQIRSLTNDCSLLIGTWRLDCTENYILKNTSSALSQANPDIPTFSLSSSSLGSWAMGGYIPKYRLVGKDLANLSLKFLNEKYEGKRYIHIISNEYCFDSKKIASYNISPTKLPLNTHLLNVEQPIFEKYKNAIYTIIIVFICLIVVIVVAFYYIVKINKLKHHLELSAVELVKAKEKAEEANKLKGAFLANMSHEIRTPLNAIVGFSGVLTTEELSNEEKEQYCNIINKNSDLLLHLINDILDISRMESGKIKFEIGECNVVDICKTALSTVECSNKTNAKFLFESNSEYFRMRTDPQRLRQVVINLLTNAAKFTSQGEILLNLNVEAGKQITIFVQDTGCGIPKEKKELVFNRFEKLSEFSQGTGLGLAICRLIVEFLGGKIWLDTDYEKGAKFVFVIPVQ